MVLFFCFSMSQLLVRNLNPETVTCLKNRAKLHHRSLQGEVLVSSEQGDFEQREGFE